MTASGIGRSEEPCRAGFARAESALRLLRLLADWAAQLRHEIDATASARGLSATEFEVLWLCRLALPSQNQIAEQLSLSPAQISALVERMRGKGLIVGERSIEDRRRQAWRLTPAGREVVEGIGAALDDRLKNVRQGESLGRIEELRDGLAGCVSSATSTVQGEAA